MLSLQSEDVLTSKLTHHIQKSGRVQDLHLYLALCTLHFGEDGNVNDTLTTYNTTALFSRIWEFPVYVVFFNSEY